MPEVRPEEVYNSGYAAALRLQQLLGTAAAPGEPPLVRGNVLVVGEQGLHDELRRVLAPGFITYGVELHSPEACGGYDLHEVATAWRAATLPPPRQPLVLCDGNTCRRVVADPAAADPAANKISLADLSPVAVVAGLDLHYNMLSMAYASLALQGPPAGAGRRALFIACNEDPQIPAGPDKLLVPGAGGMISSLATVSGVAPAAVCGKPNTDLARILFAAEGVTDPRRQCMMVGDRLTTDIAFGNGADCQTMFVLSGAETMDDVARAAAAGQTALLPTYVADSLADLMLS
ncbi:4-nitrophenyl phosphatase [Strigomonas culicis]|nr:4-nitrophenyl phosphatase [Strigomonas culicis]EPY26687.1 4-nitrophenyl phosphatase [Strigomonas culicis]|eukprot:EPY24608.1 4-nitrophenyl phosphatase [Strigomonas culicis]